MNERINEQVLNTITAIKGHRAVRGPIEGKNMVYTTKQMYDIAEAIAIENGPIIIGIEGIQTAAYALPRSELKKIFGNNGYQTRRRTWLENIEDWRDYNAIVPKGISEKGALPTPFFVVFTLLAPRDLLTLRMFAEDENVPYFPRPEDDGVTA